MNPRYTTELRRVAVDLIEAGDTVTACKLIELASKMEGTYAPPRTVATTRVAGECDRCGRTSTLEGNVGMPCLDNVSRHHTCEGTIRPPVPRTIATTRARGCTCDVCGSQITGSVFDGARCEKTIRVSANCGTGYINERCLGVYHLDPEPATDRAGNDLGVPLAELAAEQAIRDFLTEDPDHDDDIASTYRGMRECP